MNEAFVFTDSDPIFSSLPVPSVFFFFAFLFANLLATLLLRDFSEETQRESDWLTRRVKASGGHPGRPR
jgi:hypothetical protein